MFIVDSSDRGEQKRKIWFARPRTFLERGGPEVFLGGRNHNLMAEAVERGVLDQH